MPLTPDERQVIDKYIPKVQEGSLYRALHYVGDDPVKADIEDVLQRLLPPSTFKEVVAVFLAATDDDCEDNDADEPEPSSAVDPPSATAFFLISDGTTGVPETCLVVDASDDLAELSRQVDYYCQETGVPRNQVVVNPVLEPIKLP